jgi:hypothetical protein
MPGLPFSNGHGPVSLEARPPATDGEHACRATFQTFYCKEIIMNVIINPELWNTLTPVQKRAIAESVRVQPTRRKVDFAELIAWATTLAATLAVITCAKLLLR